MGQDPAKRLPTLPVAQIHRGQTGYGLTVFTGDEPERFDAEVLGVLRNTDPKMTYVLARLSGHGLEQSGVIQGMSGSPVFIDGRLVGAVAFAWPFATQAIAGITPIEAMRSIQELPSGIPAPPERMPMPAPPRIGRGRIRVAGMPEWPGWPEQGRCPIGQPREPGGHDRNAAAARGRRTSWSAPWRRSGPRSPAWRRGRSRRSAG